jgi:hypothetical protein
MAKRTVIYFEVEPELRNRCKAAAALDGTTLKQWAMDALKEKLDREQTRSAMGDTTVFYEPEGSLEEALKLVKSNAKIIMAGAKIHIDASEDINTSRSERTDSILGNGE